MGNSLGRAPWARSDTGVTTGWTEGNSMGIMERAPLGRSDTEATIGWTEGKPWEIKLGGSSVVKERYGSDGRVDGGETVGNSLRRSPWTRSDRHRKGFTHRSFYTEKSLYRVVLTQRSLHTQRLFHREAFYTEQLFHRGAFPRKSLYTQRL